MRNLILITLLTVTSAACVDDECPPPVAPATDAGPPDAQYLRELGICRYLCSQPQHDGIRANEHMCPDHWDDPDSENALIACTDQCRLGEYGSYFCEPEVES